MNNWLKTLFAFLGFPNLLSKNYTCSCGYVWPRRGNASTPRVRKPCQLSFPNTLPACQARRLKELYGLNIRSAMNSGSDILGRNLFTLGNTQYARRATCNFQGDLGQLVLLRAMERHVPEGLQFRSGDSGMVVLL